MLVSLSRSYKKTVSEILIGFKELNKAYFDTPGLSLAAPLVALVVKKKKLFDNCGVNIAVL